MAAYWRLAAHSAYDMFSLYKYLGPVVQSIVSLTISLIHKFVKQISAKVTNTLLFFLLKKCENPHIFSKKKKKK